MVKKATARKKAARKTASGSAKLTIIAEGDSWFNLPDFWSMMPIVGGVDHDLLRALQGRGHAIVNLAHWGHTVEQMARDRDYRGVLAPHKANIFILSGGGNDLLGAKFGNAGQLRDFLRQKPSAEDPPAKFYLKPEFGLRLHEIMLFYKRIITDILTDPQFRKTKIFVHGYDYAVDKKLVWIGEPMEFRMIPDERRPQIVKLMIDAFNNELIKLASAHANVFYVNLRNRVKGRWHDEIHPTREAFDDLAAVFEDAIRKAIA